MPLRTCTFSSATARCGFETSTTNCWREACRTYLIASATSGAQSDVDASPSHSPISTNSSARRRRHRSVARCAPCVAHHAISRRERAGIVDSTRGASSAPSKQQRVSLVARHGPTSPRERLASTPGDQPASVRDAVRDELAIRCCAPRRVLEERLTFALAGFGASSGHRTRHGRSRELGDATPRDCRVAGRDVGGPDERRLLRRRLARTTLRARRDLVCEPVNLGPSFAFVVDHRQECRTGLRADLTMRPWRPRRRSSGALHRPMARGRVCLSVDGTMSDLRSGARDLVRTAVAQRRRGPSWPLGSESRAPSSLYGS